jgi:uncharacterized protein (DUF58 family)
VTAVSNDPDEGADRASLWTKEGKLWLLASGVMVVAGMFKGINLLVLLAYLLTSLWILNWWSAHRILRRLRGQHLAGEPVFAGMPATRLVEVSCAGRRPVRGWKLHDQGAGFHLIWQFLHLQPGHTLQLRGTIQIAERGKHPVEPLRAHSRFPFGLVNGSIDLTPPGEIIVLPRMGNVHREKLKQWLWRSVRGDGRSRRRMRHFVPQEADLHGLRDYRPGDSPRWIHWKTSARRNQLLVREFEENIPANLILVVEPFLASAGRTEQQKEHIEQLISLAATICREWCREPGGKLILVITGAETVIMEGGTSPEHARRTMEALAVQTGTPVQGVTDWLEKLCQSVSIPMLALSSASSMTFARAIANSAGRAVASVEVDRPIPWYEPPIGH